MERYALVFRGHRFGYEVQAIAKLFLPGVRFLLCEDGQPEPEAEYCLLTQITPTGDALTLLCRAVLPEGARESVQTQPTALSGNALEKALCTQLYLLLREMTGYTPPWGMLTGIRPVRMITQAVQQGCTPEAACARMREEYLVSEEKLRLALETARVQLPILPHAQEEIGLYVSIPFCPTRCSYCSFVSHSMDSARALIPAYVEKLCEELAVLGNIIRERGLIVQSVYIGGGTPTSLTALQLRQVMEAVAEHIPLTHAREYTVEAGRADTITREKLSVIRQMGATRISVNPQTLQDSVLEVIGRRHTAQQAVRAYETAREMGFDDINMDLIAGLPTDTFEGFADTLSRVMALSPDSITVHTLTRKRAADLYTAQGLTGVQEVSAMAKLAADRLPQAGWRPYYLYRQKNTIGNLENVGYARPGKENLYNILIMDETQTILAAGCAASTKVVKNGQITRVMNYKFPYEYIGRFDQLMEKKQEILRALDAGGRSAGEDRT